MLYFNLLVVLVCTTLQLSYCDQVQDCDQSPLFFPCKKGDAECVFNSTQYTYAKLIPGCPSLGVQGLSPFRQEQEIKGTIGNLDYNFIHMIISDFRDCEVSNVKLDIDNSDFHIELLCTNLSLKGQYIIKGDINGTAIDEEGDFDIICFKYKIAIDTKTTQQDKDGQNHLQLKDLTVKGDAIERVGFLLNNNKGSNVFEKIANDNWKEVTKQIEGPILNTNMNTAIEIVNKFLEIIPFDDLFL